MEPKQSPYLTDGPEILERAKRGILQDRKSTSVTLFLMVVIPISIFAAMIAYEHPSVERYDRDVARYWKPGDYAFSQGDFVTALDDYQNFEKLHPGDAWIHHAIARTLIKMGRLNEGRLELTLAIDNLTWVKNAPPELDKWRVERDELDRSI